MYVCDFRAHESDVDEDQIRADKAAEEEKRLQEQKQREIEMARLAELEEIAEQEQEAELARQAAELAGTLHTSPDSNNKKQINIILNDFIICMICRTCKTTGSWS